MAKIIGIDLGTTNSVVAVMDVEDDRNPDIRREEVEGSDGSDSTDVPSDLPFKDQRAGHGSILCKVKVGTTECGGVHDRDVPDSRCSFEDLHRCLKLRMGKGVRVHAIQYIQRV